LPGGMLAVEGAKHIRMEAENAGYAGKSIFER
jgi:hypothetical protein